MRGIGVDVEVVDDAGRRADEDGAFLRVRGEREAVKGLCEQFATPR